MTLHTPTLMLVQAQPSTPNKEIHVDDMKPDPQPDDLQLVADDKEEKDIYTVDQCMESVERLIENMLHHVEEKDKLTLLMRINVHLQHTAKELAN